MNMRSHFLPSMLSAGASIKHLKPPHRSISSHSNNLRRRLRGGRSPAPSRVELRNSPSFAPLLPHRSFSFHIRSPCLAAPSSSSPSSSSSNPNHIDFVLADIGEGIAECEVLRWYCKPGDEIHQFDRVCEVQSDKANVEITSRYDGKVVKLCVNEGQLAQVGKPLMVIDISGQEQAGAEAAKGTTAELMSEENGNGGSPSASAAIVTSTTPGLPGLHESLTSSLNRFSTSPAVRRIAKEEGVDLSKVTATGPGGRILKEDVLRFLKEPADGREKNISAQPQQATRVPPVTTATSHPSFASSGAAASKSIHPSSSPSSSPSIASTSAPSLPSYLSQDQTFPISGLQRIMVQTMTTANTVPHFVFSDEYLMDNLSSLRSHLKSQFESRGLKLTFLPFLIKAISIALKSFPQLNAHTNSDCTALIHKSAHNIGLAMDTPRGLLVPNIKLVQEKSIFDIASDINRLTRLGKEGKIGREDLIGGTFTISNIGSIGGTYMAPVLVLPEVVIGAMGSIRTLPRFDSKGEVKAMKVMNVSWSGDHRVVDGATMARFSKLWKEFIEKPETMLVEMR